MRERMLLNSDFFNIADKRRQDSADTFRVVPELRSHAGEVAAFYAVTEASTPGPMGARARRLVIDFMQSEYASRFDLSPGARLRNATRVAHAELLKEFGGHVRVGASVLVADGEALYLLQVPPAQAYVLHDGNLHSVAALPANTPKGFSLALGGPTDPYISLFRDTIESGDTILLCGTWVADELEPEELRSAFALIGPEQIASRLFQRSRRAAARDLTCIALQAELEELKSKEEVEELRPSLPGDTLRLWDQIDDAVDSIAWVWNRAIEELRPVPGSTDPAVSRSSASSTAAVATRLEEEPRSSGTSVQQSVVNAPDQDAPAESWKDVSRSGLVDTFAESGTDELPIVTTTPEQNGVASDAPSVRPYNSSENATSSKQRELDEVNSLLESSLPASDATPSLQSFPNMTISPERIYPDTRSRSNRRRRRWPFRIRKAAYASAQVETEAKPRHATRTAARRSSPSLASIPKAMWLWSATGIVLVVILIIAASVFLRSSPGVDYPLRAKTHADAAARDYKHNLSLAAGRQLQLAYRDIRLARKHKFPSGEIRHAILFVQSQANTVHGISIVRNVPVMTRFHAPDLGLTELAIDGKNVYALDSLGQRVYGYDPSHSSSAPKVVARPGDGFPPLVSPPVTLGTLRQLTAENNTAITLDKEYKVAFTNLSDQAAASYESLVPPSSSADIVGAASYGGNLYLLDTSGGQIWKYYSDGLGFFIQSPVGWLATTDPHLLADGNSLAVAHDAIFVSLSSGQVLKFVAGQRVPFKISAPLQLHGLNQIYAREDLTDLFLLSKADKAIVETTPKGTYIRTIELPQDVASDVHAIAVSGDGKTIYILSGRALYSVPVSGPTLPKK